jgi:hypothetical protein
MVELWSGGERLSREYGALTLFLLILVNADTLRVVTRVGRPGVLNGGWTWWKAIRMIPRCERCESELGTMASNVAR